MDRPLRPHPIPIPTSSPRTRGWGPRTLASLTGPTCRAGDLFILAAAFLATAILPFYGRDCAPLFWLLDLRVPLRNVFLAVLCVAVWRVILSSVGVYSRLRNRTFAEYFFRCLIGLNSSAAIVGLIEVVLHRGVDAWHSVEVFWLFSLLCMTWLRATLVIADRFFSPLMRPRRVLLIVGSGERARRLFEEVKAHPEWNYRLAGFVDSEPQGGFVPVELILGGIDSLEDILRQSTVDEVLVALPMRSQYLAVDKTMSLCHRLNVQTDYYSDFFARFRQRREAQRDT